MIRYVFAEDDVVAIKNAKLADPQAIGEALAAIATNAGGALTAPAVVDAARDPTSPLHLHFEWSDVIAAEKFRQDQAREIIRCIRVEDVDSEQPPRAFLSVAGRGGTSYRTLGDVKSSRDLQEVILAAAQRDLDAMERRYRQLEDVCVHLRLAKEAVVQRRRRRTESRAAA